MELREMLPSDYPACRGLWESTPGVRLVAADSGEALASFLQRNPGMSFVASARSSYRPASRGSAKRAYKNATCSW